MNHFNQMPCNICWFSGCGNTLLIALETEKTLTSLGCTTKLNPIESTDPSAIDTSTILGFVVPVAAQGTFPIVWEYLENLPDSNGTPCFLIDTLGYYSGGIKGPVKKILKRKGYTPLAAKEIKMPNVFQRMKANPEGDRMRVESGKQQVHQFCRELIEGTGQWSDIPGYSWFISLFSRLHRVYHSYHRLFPVVIHSDRCKRCGLCVTLCPTNNLTMDENGSVPVRGDSCIICQRCFAYCPAKAITVGNKRAVVYHALPLDEFRKQIDK